MMIQALQNATREAGFGQIRGIHTAYDQKRSGVEDGHE